ncbi:conserved membrane family protein [Mycobacterium ulcerans str. Harvey]|uniref:Conserved membrane family protein n=1 Tax=Mycobacterium ulcerans str. Harvey TaxID=1299332 RepID=A0ABN0R0D9_MYCUL|nr:conserved membrane family protein [Mycobacterium ulcerans str. Harvey]
MDAPLPWSFTITTTEPAVLGNVVAQGNGGTIGCRITVNGEVKDERIVNTPMPTPSVWTSPDE